MSGERPTADDRFDEDLRSVLLEAAPGSVPDELRRRVAAIPEAAPTAASASPSPAAAVSPWLVLAAVAAVIVAVAIIRPGGSSPDAAGPPTTGPASPSPATSLMAGACPAAELSAHILGWQGAAGSRIAEIELMNTAERTCRVFGTPGLTLLDADGRVLIDSASAGASGRPQVPSSDAGIEIGPGGRLQTEVIVSDYCGPTPVPPYRIGVDLPAGTGLVVATPAAGVSSDDAIPPCNGPAGARIEMNGWHP